MSLHSCNDEGRLNAIYVSIIIADIFLAELFDNDLGRRDRFDNNFAHKIRSNNPRACCGMFLREKERKGRICI